MVTFFRGFAGAVPMGECELCLACTLGWGRHGIVETTGRECDDHDCEAVDDGRHGGVDRPIDLDVILRANARDMMVGVVGFREGIYGGGGCGSDNQQRLKRARSISNDEWWGGAFKEMKL